MDKYSLRTKGGPHDASLLLNFKKRTPLGLRFFDHVLSRACTSTMHHLFSGTQMSSVTIRFIAPFLPLSRLDVQSLLLYFKFPQIRSNPFYLNIGSCCGFCRATRPLSLCGKCGRVAGVAGGMASCGRWRAWH
jgi:hypothetical protein